MLHVNEEFRAEALNSVGRGTCDHCGEECKLSDLLLVFINECMCKDCKEAYQQDDERVCGMYGFEYLGDDPDSGYCTTCSGSGEGQYDGTRCWACKGSGVEK